jgi:hypothetical protein
VSGIRARAVGRRQPLLGQIELRAQQPRADAGPQRHGHRHLAIRRLAERAAVLPGDPDRGRALFGETRAVENQHAAALGDRPRAAASTAHVGVPRRMRDEVLKRLIRAGIAQARPHRLHRLAATVVEQAGDIATQRPALTLPTKQSSNCSSHVSNRRSHAVAVRSSTAMHDTETTPRNDKRKERDRMPLAKRSINESDKVVLGPRSAPRSARASGCRSWPSRTCSTRRPPP